MISQTQSDITPNQPTPDNVPTITPSTKALKIVLFVAVELIVAVGLVYIGIQIGKNQTSQTNPVVVQPTSTPTGSIIDTVSPTKTPGVTITPEPIAVITPLNTKDWIQVQNKGVFFKIPANAKCDSDIACTEVTYPNVYEGKILPLPARILINVTDYKSGSRREQFFASQTGDQDCKPIFVETKFGSVDALQIAIDGGWCQGGYNGGIVAVVGKKFVIIGPGLNYNDNKEISRWDVRDTLVSTLTSE